MTLSEHYQEYKAEAESKGEEPKSWRHWLYSGGNLK